MFLVVYVAHFTGLSLSLHMRPFLHSLLATDFSSLSLCFAATAQHSLARSPARIWDRPTDQQVARPIHRRPAQVDRPGRQAGNHLTCRPSAAFMVPPLRRRRGRARLPVERRRPGEEEWGASGGGHGQGQGSRPPDRKTEVGRKGSRSVPRSLRGQTIV